MHYFRAYNISQLALTVAVAVGRNGDLNGMFYKMSHNNNKQCISCLRKTTE